MARVLNINRSLVNIAVLLSITTLFIASSCNEPGNRFNRYSYLDSYNCEDSISSFDLSIYARVPFGYNHSVLPVIVVVTTPLGDKYSDTLRLPTLERAVGIRSVQCGMWRDYEWSYRKDVVFGNRGKWRFAIIQDTVGLEVKKVGQMGILVSESKRAK